MIVLSATKLRNNLFQYLDKVSEGETLTIQRNGKDIALVVSPQKKDWRDKMRIKVKLLVPSDKAFAPMEDIWEDYL